MSPRYLSVLVGLFLLFAPVDADAGCAQVHLASDVSGGLASAQANIEFLLDGDGGPYPCYFYPELGYADYVASAGAATPNGGPSYSEYMRNHWYANASAMVSTSGTGPGTAYAQSLAMEYLVCCDYGIYGEGHGPLDAFGWIDGPPGSGEGETLTLTASNNSPVQNSGSVTVTAQYSGGDIGPVTFSSNCTQASNMVCSFNPTTIGQHIVTGTLNGLQAQVTINVQAAGGSLRLFLRRGNGDGFDPANAFGSDDANRFEPGTDFNTGQSVSTLPQRTTLIAAFVNQNGQVVPPPQGVTQAVITLQDTTGYYGTSMNGGSDQMLDYGLQDWTDEIQSVTVSFGAVVPDQARVDLWVFDYGGSTKARATTPGGSHSSDLLGLPSTVPGIDDNETSTLNNNYTGDGLSAFEEWRGFVINGLHQRLNPNRKDLFIYHTDPALSFYSAGYATNLDVVIRHVRPDEVDNDSWVNVNTINRPGGGTPGHHGLRALRIEEGGFSSSAGGEYMVRTGPSMPTIPNNILWIRIYSKTLRQISPTHNNQNTPDPAYDESKFNQTIAHEIGHGIMLNHILVNYACPAPVMTVMLGEYFQETDGTDPGRMCAWNNIPREYTTDEHRDFRIR